MYRTSVELVGGTKVAVTARADGDARPTGRSASGAMTGGSEALRSALGERPVTFVRQVHGREVVVVNGPTGALARDGDAIVSAAPDAALGVLGADCALLAFASSEGILAVAHAGWRGLRAGVLEATVDVMRSLGATAIEAALGPCIHAECYPFSAADLQSVVDVLGPTVATTSARGDPALDLPQGVAVALGSVEVTLRATLGGCTACSSRWFSYRARGENGRHALLCWRETSR